MFPKGLYDNSFFPSFFKPSYKWCFLWGKLLCLSSLYFILSFVSACLGWKRHKNLSLKLARLALSVKRCFTVIAWLWHSSYSGKDRSSIKYLCVSNLWRSDSVYNSFILSTSIILYPWPGIWFDFFELVILLIPLSVPFLLFGITTIGKKSLDRGMLSFPLAALMLLRPLYLRIRFLEYQRVQVSSRVPFFFLFSVGLLWCAWVFALLGQSQFTFEPLLSCFSSLWI